MSKYIIVQLDGVNAVGSLGEILHQAIFECPGEHEEEGGFIVVNNGKYEFIKIRNQHTGEPCAVGFYEADQHEYGEKVVGKLLSGYKNFASFHTHPTGCRAFPSSIDLTRLFNGAKTNFIWSPSLNELNQYDHLDASYYDDTNNATVWGMTPIFLDKFTASTAE